MMNKEQIIEQIMEEYAKYGVEKTLVETIYDLGIQKEVPDEMIYPGIKFQLNNMLGFEDKETARDVGSALFESSLRRTREEYPDATDKEIADGIEIFGIEKMEESLENMGFQLPDAIKDKALSDVKKFVNENQS